MTFNDKLQAFKKDMYKHVTIENISFLYKLDKRIDLNKSGNFNYHTFLELHISEIWKFLNQLEDDKFYAVIPLFSRNARPDQPYIVLSQTFLVSKNSNFILITKFISKNLNKTLDLYDIDWDNRFKFTLKYKEIKID